MNKWENIKYMIVIILAVLTLGLLIAFRALHKPYQNTECKCVDNLELMQNEIVDNLDSMISENMDKFVGKVVDEVVSRTANTQNENSNTSQIIETNDVAEQASSSKFEIGEIAPLPNLPTHVKLCTDYRSYNLPYTPHYRLQQAAYTDENGLRRFNDDYIVGLGKFYSESIGDRFQVTLDTGKQFTVIFGDGKAPVDCDINNMYTPCVNYSGENCANVLEFIIDSDVMAKEVYAYGSIDCLDEFKGNIIEMKYLGRDDSADWDYYEF